MGNLCGSPSKDRDYEDHNGIDRKGAKNERLIRVSIQNISLTTLYSFRMTTYHKPKWKSLIVNKKKNSILSISKTKLRKHN